MFFGKKKDQNELEKIDREIVDDIKRHPSYINFLNTYEIGRDFFTQNRNLKTIDSDEISKKILEKKNLVVKDCDLLILPPEIFEFKSKIKIGCMPYEITYVNSYSLKSIDVSNNRLKDFNENLFNNMPFLENINFSCNQIRKIGEPFKTLKRLKKINFSRNFIDAIKDNLFNDNSKLEEIYFSNNYLEKLNMNCFPSSLKTVDFRNNLINKIKISNEVFISINELNLSYNSLEDMEFLQNISDIKILNLSYNRIQEVTSCLQKKRKLIEINFKKNKILSIEKNIFDDLRELTLINFSENLLKKLPKNLVKGCHKIRNIDFSFNQIEKIENIGIAGKSIQELNFSSNFLSAIDLNFFNAARINVIDLRNNIFIYSYIDYIFHDIKTYFNSNLADLLGILMLIGFQDTVKTTSRNQEKSLDKLFEKLEQVSKRNWTFIDFILSLDMKQNEIQTCLTSLNKFVRDIEIEYHNQGIFFNRIKSNESFLKLCCIENKELLESFLPVEYLKEYFSNEFNDSEDKITSFISIDDMYKFDHASAFKIASKDENEETLIFLIYLFKFMEQVAKTDRSLNFKYEKIREQFFDKCLHYIFEYKCQNIINILLDNNEIPMSFFDLPDQNELLYDPIAYKQKRLCFVKILGYIKRNKNDLSLQNAKIAATFEQEWNSLPKILYHINLVIYLIFLVFYSINIEIYKEENKFQNLYTVSRVISLIISFLFAIWELCEIIFYLFKQDLFTYLSTKNVCELTNSILCIITLFLEVGTAKSSLFSITILLTYFIFLINLYMFWKIGPFILVTIKIINKSIKLLIILLVMLIGFILSFRNRSYHSKLAEIDQNLVFNTTFEYGILQLFSFGLGNLELENMGLDNEINTENFVNFLIYIFFIFLIPLLMVNIFTGISIDEIQKLLNESNAEIQYKKIEYISNYFNFFYKFLNRDFIIRDAKFKLKKQIKRFLIRSFIKENLKNYKAKSDFDPYNEKQKYQDIKENLKNNKAKSVSFLYNEKKTKPKTKENSRINTGKLEQGTFKPFDNENFGNNTLHRLPSSCIHPNLLNSRKITVN